MPIIKLQSLVGSDNELSFFVDEYGARLSSKLSTTLTTHSPGDVVPIRLDNVRTETLQKIVSWADYHKHDSNQYWDENSNFQDTNWNAPISEWDADFMRIYDINEFSALLDAAHFLKFKGLVELILKTIANMLKDKPPGSMQQQ